jgi:hypothetical protein
MAKTNSITQATLFDANIGTKMCYSCKIVKDFSCFHNNIRKRDGKEPYCRECCKMVNRQKGIRKNADAVTTKACSVCSKDKLRIEFAYNRFMPDKRKNECKSCYRKIAYEVLKQRKSMPCDGVLEKPCSDCHKIRPWDDFPGRGFVCKACHRNRHRAKSREWSLKNDFGLTVAQYTAMFDRQGGVCAICEKQETAKANGCSGKIKELAVDHDHKTGKVRSLLCQKCNKALGLLNDDIDLLKKAISYLEHHFNQNSP